MTASGATQSRRTGWTVAGGVVEGDTEGFGVTSVDTLLATFSAASPGAADPGVSASGLLIEEFSDMVFRKMMNQGLQQPCFIRSGLNDRGYTPGPRGLGDAGVVHKHGRTQKQVPPCRSQ